MRRSFGVVFVFVFTVALQICAAEMPRRLLIVGQSPDGHPPLTHEFMPGARVLAELLKAYPDIEATVVKADEPWAEGPKLIDQADGIVMLVTQGARWMQTDPERYAALKRLAARGGAITALHWSVGATNAQYIDGQLELLGATRGGVQRKYIVSQGDFKRVDPKHPILTGVEDFTAYDEHYYRLERRPDIQPLLTVKINANDEMVSWAFARPDGGRSFGFVGLHFHANWQLPVYRRIMAQGVRWTLKLPIPEGGVKTDIDPKALEIDGKLPPAAGPEPGKKIANIPKGIASEYPGDTGIEKDSRVLFADNFENGDLKKWDERRWTIAITNEAPNHGKFCVHIPMERGKNQGGDAIKWFMPGADKVYARFYVKFSTNYQYNHHFMWLGANQRTNRWSAFGKAGLKPNGTYYSSGMEPWFAWGKNPPPGEVNLYSYFMDMKPDPRMKDKYWGNQFFPPGPEGGTAAGPNRVIPALGKWQCWEFMIQANSAPEKDDGKQAMWVDGKLVGEFSGIRWRIDPDLKVNCLWMEHYGYDEGDPTKQYWKDSQAVWFDDVVVAREYVGPMEGK